MKILDSYFEAGKYDATHDLPQNPCVPALPAVPGRFTRWAYKAGLQEGKDELRELARRIREIDS